MNRNDDPRVVLTLDAGGTNFVFSAMKEGRSLCEPKGRPSQGHDLEKSLAGIVQGFQEVIDEIEEAPVAISFAFPGPADFPNGIIGNLVNLPGFRGGIPLKAMLEDQFGIPVFINNDGSLYAYGEALAGFLPWVNQLLEDAGSHKRYHSLLGLTLGTGFGAGFVDREQLLVGDNSLATEVCLLSSRYFPDLSAEELISIRAVRRFYAEAMKMPIEEAPSPKEIAEEGNPEARAIAFSQLGRALGDALANCITLFDCPVVIGGGVARAKELIMPALMAELKSQMKKPDGETYPRLVHEVFNLEQEADQKAFVSGNEISLKVPGTDREVFYDPIPRVGIGFTRMGTSNAVTTGAYAFALHELGAARK